MALTEIKTSGIADDAITTDKLANAINTERTANTAKPTLANDANNRVVTGDGSGGLNGEANLTFDGSDLALSRSDNAAGGISVTNTNDAQASGIAQLALSGGDNAYANISLECNGSNHHIKNDGSGNFDILDGATQRLRIDANGNLNVSDGDIFVATNGHGITFETSNNNGIAGSSSLLNDYEIGYWTPTAVDGMTLHIQNANDVAARRYIKIGKVVTCWFDINYDSGNSSANFAARFSGLPFSKEATSEGAGAGVTISYFDGSETWINGHTDTANVFKFFKNGDSMYSYSNSAGDRIAGHFTYITSA